jgi:hypothetical protein
MMAGRGSPGLPIVSWSLFGLASRRARHRAFPVNPGESMRGSCPFGFSFSAPGKLRDVALFHEIRFTSTRRIYSCTWRTLRGKTRPSASQVVQDVGRLDFAKSRRPIVVIAVPHRWSKNRSLHPENPFLAKDSILSLLLFRLELLLESLQRQACRLGSNAVGSIVIAISIHVILIACSVCSGNPYHQHLRFFIGPIVVATYIPFILHASGVGRQKM